jgi:hypothetical protein
MGVDMLYWVDGWEKPWWADHGKGYLADYISRMVNEVKPGVELGFHFCLAMVLVWPRKIYTDFTR